MMKSKFDWKKIKERLNEIERRITIPGVVLDRDVLEARTRRLIRRRFQEAGKKKNNGYLLFLVGEETYALETTFLLRINPYSGSTPVPGGGKILDGIISFNDRIYGVTSSHALMGMERHGNGEDNYILFLKSLDTALLVDKVVKIVFYEEGDLSALSRAETSGVARYVKAFLPDNTGLLDINQIKRALA